MNYQQIAQLGRLAAMEKMANPFAQGNVAHVNPNPNQSAMNFAQQGGMAATGGAPPAAQVQNARAAATGDPRNPAIAQAARNRPKPKSGRGFLNAGRAAYKHIERNKRFDAKHGLPIMSGPKTAVKHLAPYAPFGYQKGLNYVGRKMLGESYVAPPTSFKGYVASLRDAWKKQHGS